MARIYLSPLIVDIRNKQKDTVFSKWKGINYIRSRVIPSNPKSAGQILVRESLAALVEAWQINISSHWDSWKTFANGKNYSGFNAFIAANVVNVRDAAGLIGAKPGTEAKLTAVTAAGGAGAGDIAITYAPTPVPAGYTYEALAIEEGGKFVKHVSWAAATASPQTISGLNTGKVYCIAVWKSKVASPDEDWSESVADCDTAT